MKGKRMVSLKRFAVSMLALIMMLTYMPILSGAAYAGDEDKIELTPEQAEAVKNWCQITKRTITIVDMLPFIPMLCFGLLTEILRYFLFIQ